MVNSIGLQLFLESISAVRYKKKGYIIDLIKQQTLCLKPFGGMLALIINILKKYFCGIKIFGVPFLLNQ
jgi:hypothetical protein